MSAHCGSNIEQGGLRTVLQSSGSGALLPQVLSGSKAQQRSGHRKRGVHSEGAGMVTGSALRVSSCYSSSALCKGPRDWGTRPQPLASLSTHNSRRGPSCHGKVQWSSLVQPPHGCLSSKSRPLAVLLLLLLLLHLAASATQLPALMFLLLADSLLDQPLFGSN